MTKLKMKVSKRKLIAIVGPTASGKTAVAVKLAREFNGEIVSADSRQVFRGMDLGTGKDLSEYRDVKYHLIDIKNPGDKFTLFDYLPLAREAIEDIFSRGKLPIIVGGTGLYIQGIIEGFVLEKSEIRNPKQKSVILSETKNLRDPSALPQDDKYNREQLNKLSIYELKKMLEELDLEAFLKVDQNNPHRLIRAIEKAQSGEIVTKKKPDFKALQFALEWPREKLYERIDQRVDERFDQGMLSEAKSLLRAGVDAEWLFNLGLEYRMMTSFLILNDQLPMINKNEKLKIVKLIENCKLKIENFESSDAMRQTLMFKSHQYAKRQLTWFRRFSEIVWLKNSAEALEKTKKFLEDK